MSKVTFKEMDETLLSVRKNDVNLSRCSNSGCHPFPVLGSSSSFSSGSVVVVGPRGNQCREVKLESGGGPEHNMSELLVNSPETKRLMEIAIANGASTRTAYKAARKRACESRHVERNWMMEWSQRLCLDSFLNQVKLEQHPQSGSLKRVLTPAAKAAKHRRTRDKKQRQTLLVDCELARRVPKAIGAIFKHVVSDGGDQLRQEHRCVVAQSVPETRAPKKFNV